MELGPRGGEPDVVKVLDFGLVRSGYQAARLGSACSEKCEGCLSVPLVADFVASDTALQK